MNSTNEIDYMVLMKILLNNNIYITMKTFRQDDTMDLIKYSKDWKIN